MKVQSLPPVAKSQASVINPSNGHPLLEATPSLPKGRQPPPISTGGKRPSPKAINRITDQTTLKKAWEGVSKLLLSSSHLKSILSLLLGQGLHPLE
jgi:hypothetical protein